MLGAAMNPRSKVAQVAVGRQSLGGDLVAPCDVTTELMLASNGRGTRLVASRIVFIDSRVVERRKRKSGAGASESSQRGNRIATSAGVATKKSTGVAESFTWTISRSAARSIAMGRIRLRGDSAL